MSSLVCKTVSFTDQNIKQKGDLIELNFESLEIQKWNVQRYRVQKVDEKDRVICLVIIFTQKISQLHLNALPKLWLIFCCCQQKIQKKSHALHFNNHNSGSEHNFYHFLNILIPFFSSTLWALSVGLSHLCIQRTSKFHFRGPPIRLMS